MVCYRYTARNLVKYISWANAFVISKAFIVNIALFISSDPQVCAFCSRTRCLLLSCSVRCHQGSTANEKCALTTFSSSSSSFSSSSSSLSVLFICLLCFSFLLSPFFCFCLLNLSSDTGYLPHTNQNSVFFNAKKIKTMFNAKKNQRHRSDEYIRTLLYDRRALFFQFLSVGRGFSFTAF